MRPLEIKICGLQRVSDALEAVRLGASATGFIFAESARRVPPQLAADFATELNLLSPLDAHGRVTRVGIFQNQSLDEILMTIQEARLTGVQLHGHETPELLHEIKMQHSDVLLIKALDVSAELDAQKVAVFARVADVILFDAPRASAERGVQSTAAPRVLNKSHLHRLLRDLTELPRFWLAGGLTPENVASFITDLRPHGVDVSGGVESESTSGQKDLQKMTEFILAARGASDAR